MKLIEHVEDDGVLRDDRILLGNDGVRTDTIYQLYGEFVGHLHLIVSVANQTHRHLDAAHVLIVKDNLAVFKLHFNATVLVINS